MRCWVVRERGTLARIIIAPRSAGRSLLAPDRPDPAKQRQVRRAHVAADPAFNTAFDAAALGGGGIAGLGGLEDAGGVDVHRAAGHAPAAADAGIGVGLRV